MKNRVFGIISLAIGILTIVTVYCLPTALGLGIYRLIVLLNGPVTSAFQFREKGHSRAEILSSYTG